MKQQFVKVRAITTSAGTSRDMKTHKAKRQNRGSLFAMVANKDTRENA